MKPQDAKYHICPRCRKQAIVLVNIKNDGRFYRDNVGNIQYRCADCNTTFSVANNGKITIVKLGF